MRTVPPALLAALLGLLVVSALLVAAVAAPELALALLPVAAALMIALLFYEAPLLGVLLLVGSYGVALDIQLDLMALRGGAAGGILSMGAAVAKVIPFAIAAMLCLRYGFAPSINWPFLAFTVIAVVSIIVLPIGRVVTNAEMIRSYVGSTAPFILAFAAAPRHVWSALCKLVILVPLISAGVSFFTAAIGFHPAFDRVWRFQGMHSPPFLAGFAITAVFAATLEYLRSFRTRWLVLGAASLGVLLLTQARAPIICTVLFLALIFLMADRRIFPLRRKVDLLMGGMVPGLLLLGPLVYHALDRFLNPEADWAVFSGRDVIWPYFLDAIEDRPLFGFGLGAGRFIVDPLDPMIRYLGSNAAHNEYLRLAVDGGVVGVALIFGGIIAWLWAGTRRVAPVERLVLRCALLAALVHGAFDNTLIASTAVIQFAWFHAAMSRARSEQAELVRHGAVRAQIARRAAEA